MGAENIEHSFSHLGAKIADCLVTLDPAEQTLFLELWRQVEAPPQLTAREEREGYERLLVLFEQSGFAWVNHGTIRYLAKLGLADGFQRFLPLLHTRQNGALIEFIIEMAIQRKSLHNILQATDKTAKIVYALKSYNHQSAETKPIAMDIRVGLESVLQIYGNLLKNGIKTTLNFEPIPEIYADPDELQQVWTNLIHNAIQAMAGSGELIIAVKEYPGEITVRFIDNGPGIPNTVAPKIFEPFFTTKQSGEGSGLGLTICKRIVEHHHGSIAVESQPGQTTFTVHLPVTSAK